MSSPSLGKTRHGVTLAELLVVIVILGLIASIAVHALPAPPREGTRGRMVKMLMAARAQAIRTRHPVVLQVNDSSSTGAVTALPDGSVIGDALIRARLHLSSLTGAARFATDSATGRD